MTPSPRARRRATLALAGLAAVSLAACGSSSTPSAGSSSSAPASSAPSTASAAAPSSSAAPAPGGKDRVRGLVATVNGGTVTLNGPGGQSTVAVGAGTKVFRLTHGQLSDITAGQCLMVNPTKDSPAPPTVTAAALLFGAPDDGPCARPAPSGARQHVGGTVVAVKGDAITLNTADSGTVTVDVTPDTRYALRAAADPTVIAAGLCLAARGTKDGTGAVAATDVIVRPSDDGRCGGRPQ